mmetsp:Transcript_24439/g.79778  ORF Transcript_24439/g.79778 Transcript_24439/m.79778 type:complete len:309 (-) Transcript_24439:382-1308(-)
MPRPSATARPGTSVIKATGSSPACTGRRDPAMCIALALALGLAQLRPVRNFVAGRHWDKLMILLKPCSEAAHRSGSRRGRRCARAGTSSGSVLGLWRSSQDHTDLDERRTWMYEYVSEMINFCYVPIRPDIKSICACMSSSCVFITNGPRAAIGSSIGSPAMMSTCVSGLSATSCTAEPSCPSSATPCASTTEAADVPATRTAPARTNTIAVCPSGIGISASFSSASLTSNSSSGLYVLAGPVAAPNAPAMTRAEPAPPLSSTSGMLAAKIGWYRGGTILEALGKFTHSWHISSVPPRAANSREWNSS